jgi:hypothetical protein
LSWLVSQGVMYVLGAAIYAVSKVIHLTCRRRLTVFRLEFLSDGFLAHSTSGDTRIRSSTCWLCVQRQHTSQVSSRPSTTSIVFEEI